MESAAISPYTRNFAGSHSTIPSLMTLATHCFTEEYRGQHTLG